MPLTVGQIEGGTVTSEELSRQVDAGAHGRELCSSLRPRATAGLRAWSVTTQRSLPRVGNIRIDAFASGVPAMLVETRKLGHTRKKRAGEVLVFSNCLTPGTDAPKESADASSLS